MVVITGQCDPTLHISRRPNLVKARQRNETPRAWTPAWCLPDRSKEHSAKNYRVSSSQLYPRKTNKCPLFRVVRGIGEYSWIEPSFDSVTACNDDTMIPSFHKLIIKKDLPLRMHEFPSTMSHEFLVCPPLSSCLFGGKIFEIPRKLLHAK
jgi:hypothetical protein